MTLNIKATYSDTDVVIVAFLRMSISNFQWRHDGLWSTVAYKTHAKCPYCEPVLLQSKGGDDCSCCNKRKI